MALVLEPVEFETCESRSCVEITIVNDRILEIDETFSVVLNRTSDLDSRITLDPTEAEIIIIDDDGTWFHISLLSIFPPNA